MNQILRYLASKAIFHFGATRSCSDNRFLLISGMFITASISESLTVMAQASLLVGFSPGTNYNKSSSYSLASSSLLNVFSSSYIWHVPQPRFPSHASLIGILFLCSYSISLAPFSNRSLYILPSFLTVTGIILSILKWMTS